MSTLRKIVSTVRSSHKLLSSDNILTDRSIAAEVKAVTNLLVKRESNLRKLWATDTLFQTIPCVELIEVPISECCDYVSECTIARSKYKIPRIAEGNYQYIIQGIWSINALSGTTKKLDEITINRYVNLLKLPLIKKTTYYMIVNDYLYVTNHFLKAVRIAAFFEEDIPNEIMFPECDCGQEYSLDDLCKNPLDKKFALPGYLEKQVLDLVSERLIRTYFQIPKEQHVIDEEPKS